jgi:aminoglycoside 6-adenylyltransferase
MYGLLNWKPCRFTKLIHCNGYYVFTFDTDSEEILTCGRMFAPAIGINEDPVTGNANGPLGAYLVRHGLADTSKNEFRFKGRQGEAIDRLGTINENQMLKKRWKKMRTQAEMMDLLMSTAQNDERIRAVIMNGSRVNPNAKRDFFQDYDIVYLVRDMETFLADHGWIKIFGEIMIMQMPKNMKLIPDTEDGSFNYLMQFTDGNRIDLTLASVEKAGEVIERESQSILLLDKDRIIEPFPPVSDADFIIKPPTAQLYDNCCNEFWWICTYVAKGIWREELSYAMAVHERYERDMLFQMIEWYIGMKTGFSVSSGKCGKYFEAYLEPELWEMYRRTYSDGNYGNIWKALLTAGDLFRITAGRVGKHFGYEYPSGDDARVTTHLKHVKELPRDAAEMYK